MGNKGTVTSSSDGVDFDHELNQPFEIEGIVVRFLKAEGPSINYKLSGQLAAKP